MSVSFLAAGGAAAVAAVITGILVGRFANLPRLDQAAWMCAATGLTIALAAQALGYHQGFNAAAFRAIQVGARLAAPVALVWGLAELTGKSFGARFAARLALAALTAIAGAILVADPLSGSAFTTVWPTADAHYQFIPHLVLLALSAAIAVPAIAALVVVAVRARREPVWRDAFPAVAAAAVAALLTEGLQVKLPVNSGYAAICLAAAVLTWYAGQRSRRLQLAALRGRVPAGDDTGWGEAYSDDTGSGRYRPDTGGFGRPDTGGFGRAGDTDFGGLYRPDTGGFGRPDTGGFGRPDTGGFERVGDTDFGGLYRPDTGGFSRPDTGGFEEIGSDTGYGFYRTDTNLRPVVNGGPDRPGSEPVPGIIETGDILPVSFDVFTPAPRGPDDQADETARLYGQIAIYTLIDGQADEFDRLAQAVVEKVKALEPDTLVYIVHGVPSAPMQRILYEVYRDEAAFGEHGRQPYIQDFEEERKPYILATNVIELGVRQAKLSPLGRQPGYPGPPSSPGPDGRPGPRGGPAGPGPGGQPSPHDRPARPSQPGQPGMQGRPSQQGQPSGPGQSGMQGRPSQQGQPVQQARSSQRGQPVQQARPSQQGRPVQQGRPSQQGQPGMQGRPSQQGQPGMQGRPSQQGRPRPPDHAARQRSNGAQ
jgi:quinol monooxygenase YgiN